MNSLNHAETRPGGQPYGAFEQKRLYQRHLLLGVGGANLFALAVLLLVSTLLEEPVAQVEIDTDPPFTSEYDPFEKTIEVIPDYRTGPPSRPIVKPPDGGVYTPVPDSLMSDDGTNQLDQTADIPDFHLGDWLDSSGRGGPSGVGPPTSGAGRRPGPDSLILLDVEPRFVLEVKPKYPSLAQRANLEGIVWLKILIDEHGVPIDVVLFKDSGTNAGFEEAALIAAWKCRFTPAIKDNRAIKVWVSVPFEFIIRR